MILPRFRCWCNRWWYVLWAAGTLALIILTIWLTELEMRGKRRAAHADAQTISREPSFMLTDREPIDVQIAAHPGKHPRTYETNLQLAKQHESDLKTIAELRAENARLKAHGEAAAASMAR